ncbi:MAG: DUF2341 domain-containing protein, partial [Verrucomicrobiota bacterium]
GAMYQTNEVVVNAFTNCCGISIGQVNLSTQIYRIAIGLNQGSGGRRIEARWALGSNTTFGSLGLLAPGSQPFYRRTPQPIHAVSNRPASNVATSSGDANGWLNASGAVFDVQLYFGATDGGNNPAAWDSSVSIGSFTDAVVNLSRTLSGLDASLVYYYTFRATNCVADLWAAPSEWMVPIPDTNTFARRLKIQTCGYHGLETLNDFPLLVELSPAIPGFSYNDFASLSGADLRFVSGSGQTLFHEIESWDTNGTSHVWVRLSSLVDGSTCLWAYWGNPGAVPAPGYTTNGLAWPGDHIGVWHLADTNATDSTGNGWDGTGFGHVDAPGIIDGAQAFDNNEYIHVGPGIDISNKAFSVSAWVRRDNLGQDDYIVAHGTEGVNGGGLHFGFR